MTEIVEFIKAQLRADEQAAQDVPYGDWADYDGWAELSTDVRAHAWRHDPARVLADVEARRYLLEWCAEVTAHFDWSTLDQRGCLLTDPNPRATHTAIVALKSLAAPYAGRPGFKPEWRLP